MSDQTFITGVDDPGLAPIQDMGLMTSFNVDHKKEDYDKLSQVTRLHQKMREMKVLDDELSTMQQDCQNRLRLVAQGETRFLEKQKQTIEYLTKFRSYIQDTDSKRIRAEKRIEEERRLILEASNELNTLTQRLNGARQTLQSQRSKLRQYARYREFLERVVENSEQQYSDVEHMISRLSSLGAVNQDLQKRLNSLENEGLELTKARGILRQEAHDQLLMKNSALSQCLKQYEIATNESVIKNTSNNDIFEKQLSLANTLNHVQLVLRNLYMRCQQNYPVVLQIQHNKVLVKPPPSYTLTGNKDIDESKLATRRNATVHYIKAMVQEVSRVVGDMKSLLHELRHSGINIHVNHGSNQNNYVGIVNSTTLNNTTANGNTSIQDSRSRGNHSKGSNDSGRHDNENSGRGLTTSGASTVDLHKSKRGYNDNEDKSLNNQRNNASTSNLSNAASILMSNSGANKSRNSMIMNDDDTETDTPPTIPKTKSASRNSNNNSNNTKASRPNSRTNLNNTSNVKFKG